MRFRNSSICSGLLYTAYSLPNTVMPLFAGVLTDRLGYRPMTVATTFLALCGSVVVLWGVAVRVREASEKRDLRRSGGELPLRLVLSVLSIMHRFPFLLLRYRTCGCRCRAGR